MSGVALCSTCKVNVGLTSDGERYLYHYSQGPGIGPVCDQSNGPVKSRIEATS